jgi:serine/threonine protein kinase
MSLGLPVPDFGSDDDPADFCTPCCTPLSSRVSTLTRDEYHELCEVRGLQFQSKSPIRCTGNSGVYRAVAQDGTVFAAKVTIHKERALQEFKKRTTIDDSPFLVQSVNFFETSTKALLLMEFCADGDITSSKLSEDVVWQLIHNIANALAIVHAAGWMHLDISPGNILRANGLFKLADFGTLTQIGKFQQGNEGSGPYVSREALEFPQGHAVSPQTDIFSFGVVLLEVLTGRYAPRGGFSGYRKLREGQIGLKSRGYECNCSRELAGLVNAMLAVDPSQRPTAIQLVDCAFRKLSQR